VLVHAQAGDRRQPAGIVDQWLADLDNGSHHRAPAHAQRAGHRCYALPVGADSPGDPALGSAVNHCRSAAIGERSLQVLTGQSGLVQRQIRFHHASTAARPATGTSRLR
jgi:hypothetical protein